MTDDQVHLDCAVQMLQGLNAGKTPEKIREELEKSGYSNEQISKAGAALIKST